MATLNSKQFDTFTQSGTGVQQVLPPAEAGGRVRRAVAEVGRNTDLTNLGSSGDVALMKLPRAAQIIEIVAATDGNVDSTDWDVGDSNDKDGLADGLDLGTSSGVTQVVWDGNGGTNGISLPSDMGKELWELLGYSNEKDAPSLITVLLTTNQNVTSDGLITFEVLYSYD